MPTSFTRVHGAVELRNWWGTCWFKQTLRRQPPSCVAHCLSLYVAPPPVPTRKAFGEYFLLIAQRTTFFYICPPSSYLTFGLCFSSSFAFHGIQFIRECWNTLANVKCLYSHNNEWMPWKLMGVVSTWSDGMKVIKNLRAFGRTREHHKCKTVGWGCGFNRCKCFAFLPKKTKSEFGQVFFCLFVCFSL